MIFTSFRVTVGGDRFPHASLFATKYKVKNFFIFSILEDGRGLLELQKKFAQPLKNVLKRKAKCTYDPFLRSSNKVSTGKTHMQKMPFFIENRQNFVQKCDFLNKIAIIFHKNIPASKWPHFHHLPPI